LRLIRSILKVTFLLFLSPLVLYCTEGDGFINKGESWVDIIDPRLQASYEAYEKEKRERAKFSKDVARFATLKKSQLDLAVMVHQYNLKGPHFDPNKFDEYTKWMRTYETEITIAMDNYDAQSYVFFFEEFVKLTFRRAGMINPNCKIKDCECKNFTR
tara:strand:- start:1963 stop:2436 length:474 start_codon:yes stop_codon:yes gene_type:complete